MKKSTLILCVSMALATAGMTAKVVSTKQKDMPTGKVENKVAAKAPAAEKAVVKTAERLEKVGPRAKAGTTQEEVSNVTNLQIRFEDGEYIVTWDRPTGTRVDEDFTDIEYSVTVYPEEKEFLNNLPGVECEYRFKPEDISDSHVGKVGPHTAGVSVWTNFDGWEQKEFVISETYAASGSFDLPFSLLEQTDPAKEITVLDVNDDGSTWIVNEEEAYIPYNSENAMDDWLIFGPVKFPANTLANISIFVTTQDETYAERVAVYMGKMPTPEGMTMQIIEPTKFLDQSGITLTGQYYAADEEEFVIGIHGCSDRDMNMLHVKDFRIEAAEIPEGTMKNNLSVTLSAPARVDIGESATITATVSNTGLLAMDGYTLTVMANGEEVGTADGGVLKFGESATHTFEVTPKVLHGAQMELTAKLTADGDEAETDNTALCTIDIFNLYPGVVNPIARVLEDGSVKLWWKSPDLTNVASPKPIVEGAEDMVSFSNGMPDSKTEGDDMGEWTVVNANDDEISPNTANNFGTYFGIPDDYKVAWIVFDTALDADGSAHWEEYYPAHTGTKSFVCPYKNPNNDWLISPELSGLAQTVSLWARSTMEAYSDEEFEVWYSTTDREIESFVQVGSESTHTTTEWEQFTFEIPAGAKYFAIRCVSRDQYALQIDDIAYEAASTLNPEDIVVTGYNIYRNFAIIDTVDADTFEYTDMPLTRAAEDSLYHLTVLYGEKESSLSKDLVPEVMSGIEGIVAADADAPVEYYNLQGIRVDNPTGGVYIRRQGGNVTKVVVR